MDLLSLQKQLTASEREAISKVLKRNNSVIRRDRSRVNKIKNTSIRSKHGESTKSISFAAKNLCPKCARSMGFLIVRSFQCSLCDLQICSSCVRRFRDDTLIYCPRCCNELLFEARSGEWFTRRRRDKLEVFVQDEHKFSDDSIDPAPVPEDPMDAFFGKLQNIFSDETSPGQFIRSSISDLVAGSRSESLFEVGDETRASTSQQVGTSPLAEQGSEVAGAHKTEFMRTESGTITPDSVSQNQQDQIESRCGGGRDTPDKSSTKDDPVEEMSMKTSSQMVHESPKISLHEDENTGNNPSPPDTHVFTEQDIDENGECPPVTTDLPERNSNEINDIADDIGIVSTEYNVKDSQNEPTNELTIVTSDTNGQPIVKGEVEFGLEFNSREDIFSIYIRQARELASADLKRKISDPYVKIQLLPDKSKTGKRRTKIKKGTLSPVFNERIHYHIDKASLETRTLRLSIWHHNGMLGPDLFLGQVTIPLDFYIFKDVTPVWYALEPMSPPIQMYSWVLYKGELEISLKYVPPGAVSITSLDQVVAQQGELHVWIKGAHNLTPHRPNGTCDPNAKLSLLPDPNKASRRKTHIVRRCLNPQWDVIFRFDHVAHYTLPTRGLEITLWDHSPMIGATFLGGLRLNSGQPIEETGDVPNWMDAKGCEAHLWKALLTKAGTWINATIRLRPSMDYK